MILRIVSWALAAIVVAVGAAAVTLHVLANASLDHDYNWSRATAQLPVYGPAAANGTVLINANGMQFRARIANFDTASRDRPAVVLLHGFPVTSAMWEPLIAALADAGYRVLAFDQRGYSPGARPSGVANYAVDRLVADVMAVADAVGIDRFHLVGHDWGAVVGWNTVMRHPERVVSWAALSIAHPVAFGEAVRDDPDQRDRSAYFLFFATPWLPERAFAARDFRMLRNLYAPMPASHVAEYIAMLSEPGALRATLNWYRAAVSGAGDAPPPDPNVDTPTLFIWGRHDQAAGPVAVAAQERFMKGAYTRVDLDAGHWLLETRPQEVTEHVLAHVQRNDR